MRNTAGCGGVQLREIARHAPEALRHGWVVKAPTLLTSADGEWVIVTWWCGPQVGDGTLSTSLWEHDEDILVWGEPVWFPTEEAARTALRESFGERYATCGYVPLRVAVVAGLT